MKNEGESPGGFGTYVTIWIYLIILTGVTVTVSRLQLGSVSIIAAICISTLKGWLVLSFFMHLRYEGRLFKIMCLSALIIFGIFISLTFLDFPFRQVFL